MVPPDGQSGLTGDVMALVNNTMFRAASSGTGTFAVSFAITGYMTPAQAGATSGAVYSYKAQSDDGTEWEVGYGTYTSSGTTLSRTVLKSSNSDSAVNFTAAPKVALVAAIRDLVGSMKDWTPGLTFGGGSTDIAYSTQTGKYWELGPNLVNVIGHIILSNKGSSTGAALITGLPHTAVKGMISFGYYSLTGLTVGGIVAYMASASTITIRQNGTTSSGAVSNSNFSNTSELIFSGAYYR